MDEAERLMFEGWAGLPQFQRKVEQAKQVIQEALTVAPATVSISWGTDSINLLHLAQQVQPDIPSFCIGDSLEDLQNNYSEVTQQYCDRFPTNYTRILYNEETDGGFYTQVAKLSQAHPMTLIGVRAEENPKRKIAIQKYGLIHQYQSGKRAGSWRAFPLAWWNWKDKWAYTVLHNLPYLKSYDHFASGHRSKSRTAVVHNFDMHRGRHQEGIVKTGAMAQLRVIAPEYFALYADLYPEVRCQS
jgi:3'-phosphoadenosine 5'-phosphosulfate sulfotransferase (PAPS reductase)/FAD synthetase